MRPVLSNTNRPPTSNRHTNSEAINILYATRYIIPLFTNVVELEFSELPLNGVLGSSLPASNHKQRQRYDVCGMCQNARSWYMPPNKKSGQRLRSTPRRRWAPMGCEEPVGQPAVPRRDPLRGARGGRGLSWSVCAFRLLPDACLFARTLLGETTVREERTRDSHELRLLS